MPRSRAWPVLGRVLFYSAFLLLAVPVAFSFVMLRTYPQPAVPTPAGWEEIALSSDGLRLRAWLGRGAETRPAAVIVHGLGDTMDSYLDRASVLRGRGHTVLLFDMRGHGGSEGRHTTLGALESHDVRAAMDHLRGAGLARSGLVLMGHSMGSVAVLLAAADQPDVRAVTVEAPYDTYRDTIAHHAKLLYGLPRWVPIIPIAIACAEWRAGFDADEADAVAAAARIRAPLLAIVDGADPRMPEPVVRRVVGAHRGPHRLWVAPGVGHVGAVLHPDYWKQVLGFLAEHGVS